MRHLYNSPSSRKYSSRGIPGVKMISIRAVSLPASWKRCKPLRGTNDVERFDEPTVVTRRHRSGTDSHLDLQDAELIVGGARWANQQRPTGPWARAALLIHRTKDGFVGWSGLATVRPRQVQLRAMQRPGPNLNTPWIEPRIRQWYLLG